MLVSSPQNKTWHGRLLKSTKIKALFMVHKHKKYCIVMMMVHRHHMKTEKEEWKTALEIDMLVKMINVMTGRKLNRTDSYLLQLIIHILNLLTKLSLFLCFSFYCFTALWKYFKSEFTVYSQVPVQRGLDSTWSWNFSPNLKMGEF